jgi:hypothetical protein
MKLFPLFFIVLCVTSCVQRPHVLDLTIPEKTDSTKMEPVDMGLNKDSLISFDAIGVPDTSMSKEQVSILNKQLYNKAKKCFALVGEKYPIKLNKADETSQTLSGSGVQTIYVAHEKLLIDYAITITIKKGVDDISINEFYLKDNHESLSLIYRDYLKGNYKAKPSENKEQAKTRYNKMFDKIHTKAGNLLEAFTIYNAAEIIPDQYKDY